MTFHYNYNGRLKRNLTMASLIICNRTGQYIPLYTPPKFNMEPENDGFQKESPFPGTSFQVPCENFRGVTLNNRGFDHYSSGYHIKMSRINQVFPSTVFFGSQTHHRLAISWSEWGCWDVKWWNAAKQHPNRICIQIQTTCPLNVDWTLEINNT